MKTQVADLGPLTVAIGANGAGKSNLLSLVKLLNAMFANMPGFRNYVAQSGFADSLLHYGAKQTPVAELELTFGTDTGETTYLARWAAAAGGTLIFTVFVAMNTRGLARLMVAWPRRRGHGTRPMRRTGNREVVRSPFLKLLPWGEVLEGRSWGGGELPEGSSTSWRGSCRSTSSDRRNGPRTRAYSRANFAASLPSFAQLASASKLTANEPAG